MKTREIKWEYKTVYRGANELAKRQFADYLNKEGECGWELVQVIVEKMIHPPHEDANYTFIFKRKLK